VQQLLKIVGEGLIGGGQRNRRRQASGQLFGKGRAGDDRQRDRITQRFAGNVLQQASGFGFQSFVAQTMRASGRISGLI
jgi:hypothetical protein